MLKKRFISLVLVVSLVLTLVSFNIYGTAIDSSRERLIKDYVQSYVSSFVENGYSHYYDIKSIDTKIDKLDINENGDFEVLVYATMKNSLKAKKTNELPFFKGMLKGVNMTDIAVDSFAAIENTIAVKNNEKLDKQQINRAAKMISRMNKDLEAYIGKVDETNFIFKYTASLVEGNIDRASEKLYIESFESFIPAEEILPKTDAQYELDGINEIKSTMENAALDNLSVPGNDKKAVQTVYASYDRLAARDYANTYTSNAANYCSHSSAKQDTAYWNTTTYPSYLYNFCHNDCADYVSQALNKGGMPKDTTWTRGSTDKSWTYAWQNCSGLRSYMRDTKKYWVASTYSAASAGGTIIYKDSNGNPYHTVMIVKNDTVTRQFSGHTNDRKQYAYSSSSSCEYYICW